MKKNRLIEAVESTLVDNAKKLQFTYDYMGRRIQKQVYAWDAASDLWSLACDLRYVYDGWNLIEVLDATDSKSVARTYSWGLDLSGSLQGAGGVGGLLAVTEHGETADTPYYTTYDANGNVSEYLESDGSVVAHYEYSPFGRLTLVDSETGAPDFDHRFSTKFFDTETRLYYYGFRYYSSELGRWLSRDPKGESGGLNVYGFVGNEPISFVDINGLWRWEGGARQGKERAVMIAEAGDTTDSAALFTMLDSDETEKWLKNLSTGEWVAPGERIEKGCKYDVPNIVYAFRGSTHGKLGLPSIFHTILMNTRTSGYASDVSSMGYKVIVIKGNSSEDLLNRSGEVDVTGIYINSHGDKTGYLEYEAPRSYIAPDQLNKKLHHKLSFLTLYACHALRAEDNAAYALFSWKSSVSNNGILRARREKVYLAFDSWDDIGIVEIE